MKQMRRWRPEQSDCGYNIRNIFALTSLLERYRMQILSAENGKTALEVYIDPDIDVA